MPQPYLFTRKPDVIATLAFGTTSELQRRNFEKMLLLGGLTSNTWCQITRSQELEPRHFAHNMQVCK